MAGSSEHPTPPGADAERAVERLAEDESLRGPLEDQGFGPLLEVASYAALRHAGRFTTTDALSRALRTLVTSAVTAAERGDSSGLQGALQPFLSTSRSALRLGSAHPLGNDVNQNARTLARALAEATGVQGEISALSEKE